MLRIEIIPFMFLTPNKISKAKATETMYPLNIKPVKAYSQTHLFANSLISFLLVRLKKLMEIIKHKREIIRGTIINNKVKL